MMDEPAGAMRVAEQAVERARFGQMGELEVCGGRVS